MLVFRSNCLLKRSITTVLFSRKNTSRSTFSSKLLGSYTNFSTLRSIADVEGSGVSSLAALGNSSFVRFVAVEVLPLFLSDPPSFCKIRKKINNKIRRYQCLKYNRVSKELSILRY